MPTSILTLNAGSSSLKFALFQRTDELFATARGEIGELDALPHFVARDAAGNIVHERRWGSDESHAFENCLGELLAFADSHLGGRDLAAIGHRVVHGGPDHFNPALVTPDLLAALKRLIPLDPLHQPLNIAPVEAIARSHPGLPQVAASIPPFTIICPLSRRASPCRINRRRRDARRHLFERQGVAFRSGGDQQARLSNLTAL